MLLAPLALAANSMAGRAVAIFLTYALFVGFGEETIFRGYRQSRLGEVLGRTFRFFGVDFGWGGIIMALLFGLMHVGVLR